MADYSGWEKEYYSKEKEPVDDVGWRYMNHAGYGRTDGTRTERIPKQEPKSEVVDETEGWSESSKAYMSHAGFGRTDGTNRPKRQETTPEEPEPAVEQIPQETKDRVLGSITLEIIIKESVNE